MKSRQSGATEVSSGNIFSLLLLVVVIISISGLFMGMRHTPKENLSSKLWQDRKAEYNPEHEKIPIAPRYKDIPSYKWKVDSGWVNSLTDLPHSTDKHKAGKVMSKADRAAAVKRRNARRAYNGAPPIIPHAIQTRDVQSCIVCHGKDSTVTVAGRNTPKMSHPYFTSCTQCHATKDGENFLKGASKKITGIQVSSSFKGSASPGVGTRAYKGAPPTIPHRLNMRQNCMACHGEGMTEAITTSHPQRRNCLQCHALNSGFDNRERFFLQDFMKK